MSAWSGIAIVALGLTLALAATGQPVWEWRLSEGSHLETWSYGLFGARHTVTNSTSATTTDASPYPELADQDRMVSLFLSIQLAFVAMVAATAAALALLLAILRFRLRGAFAGVALLAACGLSLYGAVTLIFGIPGAAGDLPRIGGQPILDFEGQVVVPQTGTVLTYGPGLAWYLTLGLGLVFAYGATEVWSLRPARRKTPAGEPAAGVALPPPPPPEPLVYETPALDEVFVIASNGLLVKHLSRSLLKDKDRDVVGGMIAVLASFVRDAFTEMDAGPVQEVILGEHRFVICSEGGLVVAVLASHESVEAIAPRLMGLLRRLRDRYGTRLDRWGGEPLAGIEDEISVLWEPLALPPPPAE